MISRRDIIAAAGAVAAVAAPAAGRGQVPQAVRRTVGEGGLVYTVVYDDRYSEGIRFAGQANSLGYRTRAISGDVTSLWYDDLYHRWKKGPAAIAGLTTVDAAMCLGMFAADAGMRCVFEAEHRFEDGETEIGHRVRAPAGWSTIRALETCGEQWPELLPRLMGACPVAPAKSEAVHVAAAPARAALDRPTMVSWVFAPIRRS